MLLIKNKSIRQIAGVLETANLLFLKLLVKNRDQARVFPGVMFRDYMALVKKEQWRSCDVFELFPDVKRLRLSIEHIPGGRINSPLDELAYMAFVTQAIQPKTVLEIGTFRGRTALNFALNSPPDCRVYTMDLPEDGRTVARAETNMADAGIIQESRTGVDYRGSSVEHKIHQLFADSMTFDFSAYHGKVDLVFVDGAHHYAAAKSDTENALKMVRPGGVILWHDFANYGDYNDVTRAVLDTIDASKIVQINSSQLAFYRHS